MFYYDVVHTYGEAEQLIVWHWLEPTSGAQPPQHANALPLLTLSHHCLLSTSVT